MSTEKSTFVYVIFIRTTPEKLWAKLTETGLGREFFFDTKLEADWNPGGAWKSTAPDGQLIDGGEVVEIDPPKRLVLTWFNHYKPDYAAEGLSRVTYELEPKDGMVKLTVIHEMDRGQSKFIQGVSNGWPIILSSLKSLMETGESLEETRSW
jgi:uncharacterized protein YndB with AHSA1/START domain